MREKNSSGSLGNTVRFHNQTNFVPGHTLNTTNPGAVSEESIDLRIIDDLLEGQQSVLH
jgi:hypothetical protein